MPVSWVSFRMRDVVDANRVTEIAIRENERESADHPESNAYFTATPGYIGPADGNLTINCTLRSTAA